ncbi:MAG: hypothetical protein R2882_11670 [Gemmatimonadales bacterium]
MLSGEVRSGRLDHDPVVPTLVPDQVLEVDVEIEVEVGIHQTGNHEPPPGIDPGRVRRHGHPAGRTHRRDPVLGDHHHAVGIGARPVPSITVPPVTASVCAAIADLIGGWSGRSLGARVASLLVTASLVDLAWFAFVFQLLNPRLWRDPALRAAPNWRC